MPQDRPVPKIYRQKYLSQPLVLYRGSAELFCEDQQLFGKVTLELGWHPYPNITIKFVYNYTQVKTGFLDSSSSKYSLKLQDITPQKIVDFRWFRDKPLRNKQRELYGYLREPLIIGSCKDLTSLVFNITNFFSFSIFNQWDTFPDGKGGWIEVQREGWLGFDGQFTFDYQNWHIVLGDLRSDWEIEEHLEERGGFLITHIFKVEHLDNTILNFQEAQKIVKAFCYYLSFVRGLWISPLLCSGFDQSGTCVFEEWKTPEIQADSWFSLANCWTTSDTTECVYYFSGFMDKWNDPQWNSVIQDSIQWYIESSKHTSGNNTCIVLVQAALEKLAWTYLSTNEYLSPDGFKKLTFADKTKLMLKILKIELIPLDENWEITKLSKEKNWPDSVEAIAQVRNLIVHPTVNKKQSQITISEIMMAEIFEVAHYYLWQSLLKIFGFSIQ
ncbi:hypothetical protein Lepto7376_0043 [[Leptolyngbya] sp. PCC 7376]|uniref:hypothetical protein n=1 Tax=[Leptolyngbya] sp. PCC 7376 TaxID=111781 RepID=UPI00029ECBBE|nr:hypothetical protein [[Leptolyngbya] sp. PCC 7376]AFY36503.1 hypothetical protein Lepto7376_0043 [[Leptolyngbya] sp. PCC 7376]